MQKTKEPRLKPRVNIKSIFREWGLILFILAVVIVASTQRPAFLSPENLVNILRSYSTYGIAALGIAFTIIGGGMDLSIGSTVSLSAVVTMLIINATTVDRVSPAYATFIRQRSTPALCYLVITGTPAIFSFPQASLRKALASSFLSDRSFRLPDYKLCR